MHPPAANPSRCQFVTLSSLHMTITLAHSEIGWRICGTGSCSPESTLQTLRTPDSRLQTFVNLESFVHLGANGASPENFASHIRLAKDTRV
jgi:hypothetical protein